MDFASTSAQSPDVKAANALSAALALVAEDALFALAHGMPVAELEQLGKRRREIYVGVVEGRAASGLSAGYAASSPGLVRALAPIHPLTHLPMTALYAQKLTLEAGARGLRSLFSSKPSDKDVIRVKRIGTLATRVLRSVLASDGELRPSETLLISQFVHGLGLPAEDERALLTEAPVETPEFELYGDIDPLLPAAIVRGAWLAAALDGLDAREEATVRRIAGTLGVADAEVENLRGEVAAQVERRKYVGLAAIDAVRYVLQGAEPEWLRGLATAVGLTVLPELHLEDGLGPIRHDVAATLGKRHRNLSDRGRAGVLALTWAAAVSDDPGMALRAVRAARHERLAADLGAEAVRLRVGVDAYLADTLAAIVDPLVS